MDDDDELSAVYQGAGQGVFAGLVAAALSHLISVPNFIVMAFVYAFSMAKLRGWPELAGILTMISTTVAYFGVFEVLELTSTWLVKTGLIALVVVLFLLSLFGFSELVDRARRRALPEDDTLLADVERSQRWEERHLAKLRARWAEGKAPLPVTGRPVLYGVLSLPAMMLWPEQRVFLSAVVGIGFFNMVLFGRMATYWRRLEQADAEAVLDFVQRHPVLYLRPFALDALPVSAISSSNIVAWLDKRTFEEHLNGTFDEFGPLIAIGRPGEDVAPLGAAREWASDTTWQQLVLTRAATAQLVIMLIDATPGVEWEIDNVPSLVGLRRVIIVLPPGADLYEERSPEWYERWALLRSRFRFLPEVGPDAVGVVYGRDDEPIVVTSKNKLIPKQLAALKTAWLATT